MYEKEGQMFYYDNEFLLFAGRDFLRVGEYITVLLLLCFPGKRMC